MAVLDEESGAGPAVEAKETEEKKQLRPYRRFVGILFTIAVVVTSTVILRGIIRHLDRMPSVDESKKPAIVDVRALRACSEDLERLEARLLATAGTWLSQLPAEGESAPKEWEPLSRQFEIDRLGIVARCNLSDPSSDPAITDLQEASNELESVIRAYGLLYSRHLEDGLPHAVEARAALKRANTALSAR